MSECAGVLQYAQTCFEGLKAYTWKDGSIVTFRPDLNAARMQDSARRLMMPEVSSVRKGSIRMCVIMSVFCGGCRPPFSCL